MSIVRRVFGLPLVVAAIMALSTLAIAPAPAQANNCQIEQLAGLPPLMAESSDPRCIVLRRSGCPNAQDTVACLIGVYGRVVNTPIRILDCVNNYHPLLNASACDDVI